MFAQRKKEKIMHSAFMYKQYLLKRQTFAMTGKFRFYAPNEQLVLFSEQKMFKLREDIRVYSDETKSQEVLSIKARQIIDFSAAYDVVDATTNQHVGTLRRRGLQSMFRDEWEVLNSSEQVIGSLFEDSMKLALIRRFLVNLIPQNYDITIGQSRVADLKQRFNIFRYELDLDFTMDTANQLDRRLGIAAAILLAAVEGRQQ
jgi:uncharacterized protein YxjI